MSVKSSLQCAGLDASGAAACSGLPPLWASQPCRRSSLPTRCVTNDLLPILASRQPNTRCRAVRQLDGERVRQVLLCQDLLTYALTIMDRLAAAEIQSQAAPPFDGRARPFSRDRRCHPVDAVQVASVFLVAMSSGRRACFDLRCELEAICLYRLYRGSGRRQPFPGPHLFEPLVSSCWCTLGFGPLVGR